MHSRQKQSPLLELFSGLDYVTLLTAMVGSLYGLALVYSATHSALKDGKIISSDVRSMLLSVALGVVICLLVSNVNYEAVAKLWPVIAAGCVGLMIYTFFFGIAPDARQDARSWIDLKVLTFQSSELLKVGFIISFSYHLDMVRDKINKIRTIIPLVIHGLIPIGLVLMTGDAGSALIFLIMFIGMLFFARINIGYFLAGFCALIVGFVAAWKLKLISGLQRERIIALFYPEQYESTMYQQNNGKIAMGNGGFLGQGFLKGDMILSVAGEEFGFIGALAVILILTILILRVGQTGLRARDNGGYLMCSGIAVMLFAQTFVNIGMELSLLPCIGITLPLFSAGGSSSLCIYLALGIEMSVYRYSKSQTGAMFYTK
mgnify:CR=1 FL=1